MPTLQRSNDRGASRGASRGVLVAVAVAVALLALLATPRAAEAAARVTADGDCLRMRDAPSLSGTVLTCIADGSLLTTVGGQTTGDGLQWQQVRTALGATGWVAAQYITYIPDPPPVATATPAAVRAFEAPPVGGMTIGIAGTSSVSTLIAAQTFPVAAVSTIDPATQVYRIYIVGAPAFANSLDDTTLRPTSVVMVRRLGDFPTQVTPPPIPSTTPPVTGTPRRFVTPPVGGMSQGEAGTNDAAALIAAQAFAVDLALVLDVPSQYWWTYIVGAPDFVNSLNTRTLLPESIVTLRRAPGNIVTPPPPPPSGGFVPTPEQLGMPPGPAVLD